MSDEELIQKIAKGDSQAFEALFQRHKRAVYGFSLRLLGASMLAEENSQEVWIRVVQASTRFEPTGTALSWILRITKNLALNTIEKRGWEEELTPERQDKIELEQSDVAQVLGRTQDLEKVKRALGKLPDRQRVALVLWMQEEKTYAELSTELKINVNAVKVLLFRAKENLRKFFKEDI